jgi:hypothetical protein
VINRERMSTLFCIDYATDGPGAGTVSDLLRPLIRRVLEDLHYVDQFLIPLLVTLN